MTPAPRVALSPRLGGTLYNTALLVGAVMRAGSPGAPLEGETFLLVPSRSASDACEHEPGYNDLVTGCSQLV